MDLSETLKNIDLSKLNSMSPEERALAISILKEYGLEGKSETYQDLLYEDYQEKPVDILTFVDDNRYLGTAWHDAQGNSKLYPYWRKELLKLFPDNLTTSVNNAIFSGSRGRGKSEICVLIACYLLHRILCLKNPIEYYHLKSTEKIVFAFMNIKLALAQEIATTKFQNTIKSSPWFLAHGTLEGRTKKVWVPNKYLNANGEEQEAVDIKIGSQADDLIGLPIYFAFFDEISFIKNKSIDEQKAKANDMIDTAIGGMKTRFVHKGKNPTMLCLASSKRSDKSFLEEHMKKKLESEKENVYISDGSVWEVKPKGTYKEETFKIGLGNKFLQSIILPEDADEFEYIQKGYKIINVPVDFKADFIDDIDRALCDFAGISSSSITKYINGEAVKDTITNRIRNPFIREVIEVGNGPDDDLQYYNFFDMTAIDPKLKEKPLFIHLDMSVSGDKTGIAGIFINGKKTSVDALDQSKDLFFTLAFSVSVKPPKGRQVSFEKNRNFIYWLKAQGFNIKGISSDSFQAVDFGQIMLAKGYNYKQISVDKVNPSTRTCLPYQYFKSTIYEKRIEIYEDKLLIMELTDLERNMDTGKVDHPDGHCFTGETEVYLVDGRTLNFYDLVKEYNEGKVNYVYSMNLVDKRIEPKRILKAWKTLENQPLVRLTFDNGESVECTYNHKFMLRNGDYIEAKDMIPGESLMPLYKKYPDKGPLKNYPLYYEPFEDAWHYEHRSFATEVLDEKYLVHHKDCNPNNNCPDNLVWCSRSKHMQIHEELETGANSAQAKIKKAESVRRWHEKNKGTKNYQNRSNKTRESVLKYNFERYGYNRCVLVEQHKKEVEDTFGVVWDTLSPIEKGIYSNKLAKLKDPTICSRISGTLSQKHREGRFENAYNSLRESNNLNKQLKILYPEIDKEKFFELFGFNYDDLPKGQKAPWTNRYRQKLHELLNHKLVSIEFINKKADVYDIEVEDNHNFALACGVFVHNSKDKVDAVCGAVYHASQYAEEFAYDYGESAEKLLQWNSTNMLDNRNIYDVEMEKELMRIGRNCLPPKPVGFDEGREDYNLFTDIILI